MDLIIYLVAVALYVLAIFALVCFGLALFVTLPLSLIFQGYDWLRRRTR